MTKFGMMRTTALVTGTVPVPKPAPVAVEGGKYVYYRTYWEGVRFIDTLRKSYRRVATEELIRVVSPSQARDIARYA
jgi:hypothetical protein